jgi:hypothetical protein
VFSLLVGFIVETAVLLVAWSGVARGTHPLFSKLQTEVKSCFHKYSKGKISTNYCANDRRKYVKLHSSSTFSPFHLSLAVIFVQ